MSGTERNYDEILYIYDRVCTREAKQREILREYGGIDPLTDNPSRERVFQSPAKRARPASGASVRPEEEPSRPGNGGVGGNSRARVHASREQRTYQFRPDAPEGGEAVKEKPWRAAVDWILGLFELPEGDSDASMRAAKRKALAVKRWREYRHIILTVFLLFALSAGILAAVYRIFFVVKDVEVTGSVTYDSAAVAEAAGIAEGDMLYSFRASDAENSITFLCPYIRAARVSRTVPTDVSIVLEEDRAAYYANIWGDTVLLSEGLRVLEAVDPGSSATAGLTELILPPVDKSVAGRVLAFTSPRAERYIRSVLSQVTASPLWEKGMVDRIVLTDEYDITMKAAGIYTLVCGGETDMNLKMKMAYVTITSGKLDGEIRATINLKETGEAVAMYDFSESGD